MATTLPSKRMSETLDYTFNWTDALNGDTIASSVFSFLDAQGATITTQTSTTKKSTVWIAGGIAGATVRVKNVITSVAGRVFESDASLQITP
jgi:hypothetical protein